MNSARPKAKADNIARVREGQTEYIALHREDGVSILNVDAPLLDVMTELVSVSSKRSALHTVLQSAYKQLTDKFSDRIDAIAKETSVHDGCIILRVKPRGGIFNMQLANDLSGLAWELEDELRDLTGDDTPPVTLGFRQEFPDCPQA